MMTSRAGVLGSPIAHSLSPVLHRAGYAALGLTDWEYTRHEVREDDLAGFLAECDDTWRGLSLTMPLKEAALDCALTVSEVARRARAANTLVRRADGAWDATNTDVEGIVCALRSQISPRARRGCVVGSGATARSAVLAMADLGLRELVVAARNPHTAAELVALGAELGLASSAHRLGHWGMLDADVVVSTVPASGSISLAAGVPADPTTVLLDVVYAHWPTPLAQAATGAGMVVISGLDMLVHQAAAQFTLFTGQPAPVEAMLAAGRAALVR